RTLHLSLRDQAADLAQRYPLIETLVELRRVRDQYCLTSDEDVVGTTNSADHRLERGHMLHRTDAVPGLLQRLPDNRLLGCLLRVQNSSGQLPRPHIRHEPVPVAHPN